MLEGNCILRAAPPQQGYSFVPARETARLSRCARSSASSDNNPRKGARRLEMPSHPRTKNKEDGNARAEGGLRFTILINAAAERLHAPLTATFHPTLFSIAELAVRIKYVLGIRAHSKSRCLSEKYRVVRSRRIGNGAR